MLQFWDGKRSATDPTARRSMLPSWLLKVVKFDSLVAPRENRTSTVLRSQPSNLPDPAPGEVLVRNVYMSVDPYMRGRMNEGKSYVPQFEIGKPLEGAAVGRVIASHDEKLPEGTFVLSMYGWREAFVAPVSSLRAIDPTLAPPSAYLGILGVTGLTAWVGLFSVAKLKDGETVFISAGAGAVGSAACQFAKMHGCRSDCERRLGR